MGTSARSARDEWLLPTLEGLLSPEQFARLKVSREDSYWEGVVRRNDHEISLQLRDADCRKAISILIEEQKARVAAVFAEDRRSADHCFLNHYVIEIPLG